VEDIQRAEAVHRVGVRGRPGVGVIVGVIQAVATTRQGAAVILEAVILLLRAAATSQEVAVIYLEVGVTPCRQRSRVAVGLEVLSHRAKQVAAPVPPRLH
jgi:hypothetical protein